MENFEVLIATIAAIIVAVGAYGKYFSKYQVIISEAVIEAFAVQTRYKLITNFGVGIAIAVLFTLVAAYSAGLGLEVIAGGIAAGFLAAAEASKLHDEQKVATDE